MKKLSIIIPVYNEKNTILKILEKIGEVKLDGIQKEVIIVDDFSTDGTKEILKDLDLTAIPTVNYKVFFQGKNMGKGSAVKNGFEEAGGDIVLIQDADLEYNPDDYAELIRPIAVGQADIVYGSRFLESDISSNNKIVYRRGYFFSRLLNFFSNILSGLRLSDIYTCYKVFSKEAVKKITPRLKSNRFGIDPELTALVAKNRFRILEVPIHYQGRTYEEGKKINWKDGLTAIFHIIRFNIFR